MGMTYSHYYMAAKAQGASDEAADNYAKEMMKQWQPQVYWKS